MYLRKNFYVWLTTHKHSLIPRLFHAERRNEPMDEANANVTSRLHGILPRPNVLHITQDTAQRIWSWNKNVMYTGQLHSTVHFPASVFNS